MSNLSRNLLIAGAVAGLGLLMIAATRVGGIAIRSDFTEAALTSVSVSSPAVRGVPVLVRWESGSPASVPVLALFRDATGDQVIGVGNTQDGSVRVEFPCETPDSDGNVVIIDKATQNVLGQTAVTLFSPGTDCALR